jgi:hypothetical protein
LKDQNWSPINCRGKKQVLELYTLISKHPSYSNARVAFFIDRDFDSLISNEMRRKVYETPCYSVENFYASLDCFTQILKSEFGITDGVHDGTALQKCQDLFLKTKQLFHDVITELNAWVWIQRNNHKNIGALNLRNIKFDRFVAVGLGSVSKLYSISELKEIFPDAPQVDESLLASKITEFQTADRAKLFRGKYEVEFLRMVLIKLVDDYRSQTPVYFPQRGTVRLTLSRENLISELSQYADTPDCLRNYLLSLN